MKHTHLVFVYGTLKRGHGLHRLLKQSTFVGAANLHDFMIYDLGPFPGIKPASYSLGDFERSDRTVEGELYKVDDLTLARIDRTEGHPNLYERTKVEVWMKASGIPRKCSAYIYTGDPTGLLPRGRWPETWADREGL